MKVSLTTQVELELVVVAAYYARNAHAEIAAAFILEFDRSAKLLGECPRLALKSLRAGHFLRPHKHALWRW